MRAWAVEIERWDLEARRQQVCGVVAIMHLL